jgi:hypothetical protein
VKIFVSSVMQGFAEYREAAFSAIRSLDHEIIRAEDFPASTTSSKVACLQAVRQADLVILVLGERYGWSETTSGLSPTHEEFREGKEQGKVIPFVQANVTPEPAQQEFIAEVENYDAGMHRGRTFETPDQLREEVTRAIARHQLAAATTPVDVPAMLRAAEQLIPRQERHYTTSAGPLLHLAVVGGPSQPIIRPSEIEAPALADRLVADLTARDAGYFSYRLRTDPTVDAGALIIRQENGAAFRVDEAGAMLLSVPIEKASGYLNPLIEEHVQAAINRALTFADTALEQFDPTQRLTRVVLAAGITSNGIFGWRTAREHLASPDSMQIAHSQEESKPVHLNPPDRTRMALRADRMKLSQDLLSLLRRAVVR